MQPNRAKKEKRDGRVRRSLLNEEYFMEMRGEGRMDRIFRRDGLSLTVKKD